MQKIDLLDPVAPGAGGDTFGLDLLSQELTLDEKLCLKPYCDTEGKVTIGVGRNLTDDGISYAEAATMLANDIHEATADLDRQMAWWRGLPPAQQRVMANLSFNMGIERLTGFVKFLAAMRKQDWVTAQAELRDSKWFGQVGERGPRMLARLAGTIDV